MNMLNPYHIYRPLEGQSVSNADGMVNTDGIFNTDGGGELYAALPAGEWQQEPMWNQQEEFQFQGEMTNWERRKYGASHRITKSADNADGVESVNGMENVDDAMNMDSVDQMNHDANMGSVDQRNNVANMDSVDQMNNAANMDGMDKTNETANSDKVDTTEAAADNNPVMDNGADAWQEPVMDNGANAWQEPVMDNGANDTLIPGNPALTYDTPTDVAPGEPPMMPGQMDDRTADLEYFEGMYPRRMKEIKIYVNIACDALEYKGSPLYDEYPDRIMADQLVERIYQKMKADGFGETVVEETEPEEVEVYEAAEFIPYGPGPVRPPYGPGPARPPYGPGPVRPPYGPGPARPPYGPGPARPPYGPGPARPPQNNWGKDDWLRDIISVLLFQEMFKRRCRNCR